MAKRKDGLDSKNRLQEAAIKVFAEKGYEKTTIADICEVAGTNIAAVNYYFGSKDKLYANAWCKAFEDGLKKFPVEGGLPPEAPATARLRETVSAVLHRMLDTDALGSGGQLLIREFTNPTKAIASVKADTLAPLRARADSIIRELLGAGATGKEVAFCAMSVFHQCLAFGLPKGFKHPGEKLPQTPEFIDELAEHVTLFSLAGIAAVRKEVQSRQRRVIAMEAAKNNKNGQLKARPR
jgi:AcrR family transcriptional regulator